MAEGAVRCRLQNISSGSTTAKKAKADRQDPRSNKSLAIREIIAKMPKAKAAEIAEAVKAEYGHTVTSTLVYLVKSKSNVKQARRKTGKTPTIGSAWTGSSRSSSPGDCSSRAGVLRMLWQS